MNADELHKEFNSTRRKPTGGFHRWLWEQCGRDDPVGDLAYDFVFDSDWTVNPTRYEDGTKYLSKCGASNGAFAAYRRAWREYSGEYWGGEWKVWLEEASKLLLTQKDKEWVYFVFVVPELFCCRPPELYTYPDDYRITSRCKIGRAKNIKTRFSSIQTSSPVELELYHIIRTDDSVYLEGIFHRLFCELHTRGEWFDLDKENIEEWIKPITSVKSSALKEWEANREVNYGHSEVFWW